jgi:hypothetical protein
MGVYFSDTNAEEVIVLSPIVFKTEKWYHAGNMNIALFSDTLDHNLYGRIQSVLQYNFTEEKITPRNGAAVH